MQCGIAVAACCAISGCGGGGGGDAGSGGGAAPLGKYEGTYSYCDGNERLQLVVATTANGRVTLAPKSDFYRDANCTGAIVGTEVFSSPLTASFQASESAVVTGWPTLNSAATYTVDRVTISVPALTITLTGTGVSIVNGKLCVTYSNGRTCLDETSASATTFDGGLVLTNTHVLLATKTAGGYAVINAYPK